MVMADEVPMVAGEVPMVAGEVPVVPARPAATVALVRDGAAGLEVYLMRRVQQMTFAPGMHVFPGGSVDPSDACEVPWQGRDPRWWAAAFGLAPESGRALVVAAVREMFEECGLLLAARPDGQVVDAGGWADEREDLEAGRLRLADLLRQRGLRVRADLLAPLAHWVTPEVAPKRFDTHFLLAVLPPGRSVHDVGTEADARLWVRPAEALAGGLALLPPTSAVLSDLARFATAAEAFAAQRVITRRMWR
jgi:8-oxo-dGTP pyrophosphatase MutT (NUDIX family)